MHPESTGASCGRPSPPASLYTIPASFSSKSLTPLAILLSPWEVEVSTVRPRRRWNSQIAIAAVASASTPTVTPTPTPTPALAPSERPPLFDGKALDVLLPGGFGLVSVLVD